MKNCRDCNIEKPYNQFYKQKATSDGLNSYCKTCSTNRRNEWLNRNRIKVRASAKKWREENANRIREHKRRSLEKNKNNPNFKLKVRARLELNLGVRYGRIEREHCFCGESKSEGHHPNYNKPLDVIWLCKPHHDRYHQIIKQRR
jgi:hypothetical protein